VQNLAIDIVPRIETGGKPATALADVGASELSRTLRTCPANSGWMPSSVRAARLCEPAAVGWTTRLVRDLDRRRSRSSSTTYAPLADQTRYGFLSGRAAGGASPTSSRLSTDTPTVIVATARAGAARPLSSDHTRRPAADDARAAAQASDGALPSICVDAPMHCTLLARLRNFLRASAPGSRGWNSDGVRGVSRRARREAALAQPALYSALRHQVCQTLPMPRSRAALKCSFLSIAATRDGRAGAAPGWDRAHVQGRTARPWSLSSRSAPCDRSITR
jgi:hypothetical protein